MSTPTPGDRVRSYAATITTALRGRGIHAGTQVTAAWDRVPPYLEILAVDDEDWCLAWTADGGWAHPYGWRAGLPSDLPGDATPDDVATYVARTAHCCVQHPRLPS